MVESLVVEFDQAKYEEFLSSGSKSPKTRVCRRVSTGTCPETRSASLSGAAAEKGVAANRAIRNTRANVSQETRVVKFSGVPPIHPLPQHRLSLVSLNPHDVTGTLSADREGVRVNCKSEQLIIQLRQDARFKPASLLYHIRHVKSAFGSPNTRFIKLAPLKPHSPDAKAKLARLVEYKKHTPLGVEPSSLASLKRLCPDVKISNAIVASPLTRDARRAF